MKYGLSLLNVGACPRLILAALLVVLIWIMTLWALA